MKRTQLYLDEEMARTLGAESRRRGTTISALVREAVQAAYGRPEAADRRGIIDQLAGVWSDRVDLGTEEFVRSQRRSARPARWIRGVRGEVPARHRRDH